MKRGHLAIAILTWLAGIALLVAIIAYLAGAFRAKTEPGKLAEPAVEAPKFANIETVREDVEPLLEKAPGTLSALRESMISARIMARINEISVRSGDKVVAGQTLARLDSRDLSARVNQADQGVSAARARLANAQSEYDRAKKLVADGIVSRSDFDAADAAFQSAKAEVARAEAATSEAGTGKAFAVIEAPFDGRVVDRYAEPGDMAMPGAPLLKIYDPSRMRLETYLRESLAATLKPGTALQVEIDALKITVDGKVEEIVPQSEPGSRSILVKVSLPERDDLYPGMFGRLLVPAGTAQRIFVPEAAVLQVGQLAYVWVVGDDDRPQRRFIKLGSEHKQGWIEVLSGLKAGERVGEP